MFTIVQCPSCKSRLKVADSPNAKKVKCTKCGELFIAPGTVTHTINEDSKPDNPFEELDEPDISVPTKSETNKSFKLVAGLIGGCVLVIAIIIGVIAYFESSKSQSSNSANIPNPNFQKAGVAGNNIRNQANPFERDLERQSNIESLSTMVQFFAIIGLIVLIAYFGFILFAGSWIARDANRRGMNGVGWCAFFFAFHVGWKVVATALSSIVITMIFVTRSFGVTAITLLILEVFSWTVGFAYWYSRRPGRLTPCPNCKTPTLAYMKTCPTCGHS